MSWNPLTLLLGDASSDQVVPPKGRSTWLTGFASGAMAFIAVFALTLSLAVGRLADYWTLDLARTATVQIVAEEGEMAAQTQAALQVLRTSPGVVSAEVLNPEAQLALLKPWLGSNLSVATLPLPQLIEVRLGPDGPDVESLKLRLAAEAPGASFDDQNYWRTPILEAAERLKLMVAISLALTLLVTMIIVVISAQNALTANQSIIRTLRLLGARDSYIARAFVRRVTLRATIGALVGMVLAMLVVFSFPATSSETGLLVGLSLQGADWVYPLLVPLLVAISTFFTSRIAARYHLHTEA